MKTHAYNFNILQQTIRSVKQNKIYLWQPGELLIPNIDPKEVADFGHSIGKQVITILNKDFYYFWAYKTVYHSGEPIGHNYNVRKCFTSLNGKKRYYRSHFVDTMAKYKLQYNNYISMNLWNWNNDDYPFQYIENKPMILDGIGKSDYWNLPISQLKDSMFSVVSESGITKEDFITEKTWLPIFNKRPFVIFGPIGIHAKLKSIGFELFEEYFDYSFDREHDYKTKAEDIIKQVAACEKMSYNKALKKIKHKLEHNYNLLINKVRSGEWLPNLPIDKGPHAYLLNTLWTS